MRTKLGVAGLLAAVLATVALAPGAPAAVPDPLVVVYGDSLVDESTPYLQRLAVEITGRGIKVRGASGGALCDLLPEIREDAARLRPVAVILSFSGNALTRCMQDGAGQALHGDALVAKYHADADAAIAALAPTGATVWLATSPISWMAQRDGDQTVGKLAVAWRDLAQRHPLVHVANAAHAVLERGAWTLHKPCLPLEPCTGPVNSRGQRLNQIRAVDTAHFCPVPYPAGTLRCPVHASGALRYALGMLVPALYSAGRFDAARFEQSIGAGWRG